MSKTTKEDPSKQADIIELIPERHTYDTKLLKEFLEMVFHAGGPDDANVLTWAVAKMSPGYPIGIPDLLKKMARTAKGMALYFGTSTTARDEEDNRLYNRKALFRSFHVLVLDDIGKKVPFDKIPDTFDPTYKIETSPGSYHYGYVLEEPILDEAQAAMLVQLAYDGGFSDSGGKMATKLVRLPAGINGKDSEDRNFKIRLEDMDGPFWTPETILEELDVGVTWQDVLDDVEAVKRARAITTTGTSVWSPITAMAPSLDGIIDPALEWLYEKGMVRQETNEWVTIKCPWADLHTSGDGTAGYSPMGWGSPAYINRRTFHCFHEHCQGMHASEFLDFIRNAGGPELAVKEYAYDLVKRYVYDPGRDGVWNIMDDDDLMFISMKAFATLHPKKTFLPLAKGSTGQAKAIAETALFTNSPARVVVKKAIYDTSNPDRILTNRAKTSNYLNMCQFPAWGDGDYDQEYVDFFADYLEYLIPDEDAREYFLDWLGAKVQDMAFRGTAIIMIAPQQGTGRGILAKMITDMFGITNVTEQTFEKVVKDSTFNPWMSNAIVVVNETHALADGASGYKAAERLKERIDTSPTPMTVNIKNVNEYREMNYTSYLMFSNNADAMMLAHDDRRFYIINNNPFRESAEYFVKVAAWRENVDDKGSPVWCQSVWRWLRQREVDVKQLLKPAELTQAKIDMVEASKQAIDVAVEAVMDNWPSALIAQNQVTQILGEVAIGFHYENPQRAAYAMRKVFSHHVTTLNTPKGKANRFKTNGINGVKLWVVRANITDDIKEQFITSYARRSKIDIEREKMPDSPFTEVVALVREAMASHDFQVTHL